MDNDRTDDAQESGGADYARPATLGELVDATLALRSMLLSTLAYMVADYGPTEEEKKKAAIDSFIERFDRSNKLLNKLMKRTPTENHEDDVDAKLD